MYVVETQLAACFVLCDVKVSVKKIFISFYSGCFGASGH